MIRFVKHQDINPESWNRAVENAENASVFAKFEMLDILTGDATWHAAIKDDYTAVLPLPYRQKFGFSYLYTPFFLPQMGIYAESPINSSDTLMFFNIIPRKFFQVDLLFQKGDDITKLPDNHLVFTSHELDLKGPFDALWDGFSQNTRRNIKSAEKHFLTFEKNEGLVEEIIQLFKNNRGKDQAVHYKDRDYQTLLRAANFLLKQGNLDVVGVRNTEKKLIAGALMVRDHSKIWFWFSGRDETAAESRAMFFLLHEYLKDLCDTDLVFDFNGSNNENVARFYRGFGGLPYSIPMLQYSRLGILNLIKKRGSKK